MKNSDWFRLSLWIVYIVGMFFITFTSSITIYTQFIFMAIVIGFMYIGALIREGESK